MTEAFTAFEHAFSDRVASWKQDLRTLEAEGATYEEWLLDEEDGGPGLYRVRFRPSEIHRYVRAILAWDEFLLGGFSAVTDRPLAAEAARSARTRAGEFEQPGENSVCPADFLGDEVEALVCGSRLDRAERIRSDATPLQPIAMLHEIASSLPIAVRALGARFAVSSEKDFQDLLFLVLRSTFRDTKREEWTPSAAGNSKRVDIAIPSVGVLVETKFVRNRAHGRRVADELRVDIESYHSHPSCETLVAIVWDAANHLPDPQQLERDLSAHRVKGDRRFDVTVRVAR